MASIRQNAGPGRLPDFANLGVLARILIGVCIVALIVALARARGFDDWLRELIAIASAGLFPLLLNLIALIVAASWLRRLSHGLGSMVVLGACVVLTATAFWIEHQLAPQPADDLYRHLTFAGVVVVMLLAYFELRGRALSPALTEARLQALQARIRPHFLFNSINAVLSLIRSDPKRAETALEDMADLFRVLMADNSELTSLAREVELCRQYLSIEQLRLGERLQIEWRIERMPADALIPPLVLQPLIENAVYHGIEPRAQPGVVCIDIHRRGNEVHAVLRNPYKEQGNHHAGNRMAVDNIRERLALHFDAEASLKTTIDLDSYQVHITLPYRKAPS